MTRSTPPAALFTPPPAAVTPPPPPAAVVRHSARRQTPKRTEKKGKISRVEKTKPAANRPIRAISAEAAGSPDTLLLVGGLALFVLVLADTVFLTLSRRSLRAS